MTGMKDGFLAVDRPIRREEWAIRRAIEKGETALTGASRRQAAKLGQFQVKSVNFVGTEVADKKGRGRRHEQSAQAFKAEA